MMNLIQMLQSASDPMGFMMNMMQNKAPNTPYANNAMNIIRNGDVQGAEQMVRNLCKSQGIDVNEVVNRTRNMFGR